MSIGVTVVDEPREYWFNIKTGEVEIGKQVAALFRVGPFSDFETAAKAPEILRARAKAWRDEDELKDQNQNDDDA